MQRRLGRILALSIFGVIVMGGGAAWAQAVEDTSRTSPTGVEPAGVDTLPTGEWEPPLRDTGPTPSSDTGDGTRAFVNADSLSTRQREGERVQELFGNVFVQQDTTRLRSEYGLRYLTRDELLFIDNVVIYERGDTLRADTVRYNRATEVGRARGNVQLTNGDVIVQADSARYYAAEKRSVFPDSVVLVDGDRVLRAQFGTYWSDEERAEFGGHVRLTEPGTTLLSDSLTYYRDRDRSIARGNVFIDRWREDAGADTTARTYLFGDWADNREARRYSRVEGNALLTRVRMDSTGAPTDTLVVKARRLDAFRTDTHRRLVAVGSVRFWQPDLAAVADSAVYDRVVAPTPDSAAGEEVPIDTTRPPPDSLTIATESTAREAEVPVRQPARPDSVGEESERQEESGDDPAPPVPDTSASDDVATEAAPPDTTTRPGRSSPSDEPSRQWNTPVAQSDSVLPLEETRLFRSPITWFEDSQVWGDSIRVRARDRSPDTVFVRGSAFAAQRDSVLDRIQQLKAENIVAFFNAGSLQRIRARPNARAIRFLATENDSLNGAARTSGDRIELRFADGRVKRVSVIGGTQTTYYRKNENIPDPFELEGFQWTPDQRPTRRGLLRDERVRRHLDLDVSSQARPIAGPPSESAFSRPPDSTGHSSPRPRRAASQTGSHRPWHWTRPPAPPSADSLRFDRPVSPDSVWSLPDPRTPADTSETNRPPNP